MNDISKWILDYAFKNNIESLVIGISGGIDSAVVSTLCCETGLSTYLVSMPIHQEQNQLKRANKHINWLIHKYKNATAIEKNLTELFDNFSNLFDLNYKTDLSLANSRSRLRMVTLYQIAGSKNGIVVGTGNKVEDFGVGFFTKYGDGGVDISPIADFNKTEVRKLAKELGVCNEILIAKPTDGLWSDDRSDEDQIGATYEELEWAMSFKGNLKKLSERQKIVLKIFKSLNKKNKHKIIKIPVYKNK